MKLITKERKVSEVVGTGIQYLPGHKEAFVDLVVEKYALSAERIADLGGGGFRFAFPVALAGKALTVVDMDPVALQVEEIKKHVVAENPSFAELDTSLITTIQDDALSFLRKTQKQWDFISAFRLLHFFSPQLLQEFFELASQKLADKGLLIISGLSPYETDNNGVFNEIYLNSSAQSADGFYRKFNDSEAAQKIRQIQNLQEHIHLFGKELVADYAAKNGFAVLQSDILSTRVIYGYILEKI